LQGSCCGADYLFSLLRELEIPLFGGVQWLSCSCSEEQWVSVHCGGQVT
jgi:hypothetical protein